MNYDEFIDRVNDKVRTEDEWPESASVTAEQVHLSWLAAIAIANILPLGAFSESDFTNDALTGASSILPALDRYSLPETVFRWREDLGIASVFLDDIEYQISEAQPIATIRNKATNKLYKDAKLFGADLSDRLFYALNTQQVKINHLTAFSAPATGDIDTTEYPLDGTHAEQAASVVASHVLGELKRDMGGAQFQALLQSQYGAPAQPEPQPAET